MIIYDINAIRFYKKNAYATESNTIYPHVYNQKINVKAQYDEYVVDYRKEVMFDTMFEMIVGTLKNEAAPSQFIIKFDNNINELPVNYFSITPSGWLNTNVYKLYIPITQPNATSFYIEDKANGLISDVMGIVRVGEKSNLLKIKPETEFYITTSWAVKFLPGGSAHEHSHVNSLFSGVLYLKAAEETGQITFHKYQKYLNFSSPTISLEFTEQNIFNSSTWSITPIENQIIIFPSNLMHSVDINNSKDDRISVAFNMFVRGNFGGREAALTIK